MTSQDDLEHIVKKMNQLCKMDQSSKAFNISMFTTKPDSVKIIYEPGVVKVVVGPFTMQGATPLKLILGLSTCNELSEEMRRECRRLYAIAEDRDGAWSYGKSTYFILIDTEDPWEMFMTHFSEMVPKTMAAYVNTRLTERRPPLSPCRLVFFGIKTQETNFLDMKKDLLIRARWLIQQQATVKTIGKHVADGIHIHVKPQGIGSVVVIVALCYDEDWETTHPLVLTEDAEVWYRRNHTTVQLTRYDDEFHVIFPYSQMVNTFWIFGDFFRGMLGS